MFIILSKTTEDDNIVSPSHLQLEHDYEKSRLVSILDIKSSILSNMVRS